MELGIKINNLKSVDINFSTLKTYSYITKCSQGEEGENLILN